MRRGGRARAPSFPSSFLSQALLPRGEGQGCGRCREAARRRPPRTGEQQPAGRVLRESPERASRRASLRRGIGAGEHERGGGRRRRDAPAGGCLILDSWGSVGWRGVRRMGGGNWEHAHGGAACAR